MAADGDMEGMPLVIAEAMATGLPVIGTRHSGIPEAVRAGENGRLLDERDERAKEPVVEAHRRTTRRGTARRQGTRAYSSTRVQPCESRRSWGMKRAL